MGRVHRRLDKEPLKVQKTGQAQGYHRKSKMQKSNVLGSSAGRTTA